MIRHVTADDAAAICSIYNLHVLNTVVTFEEEPVSIEEMQNRIATITSKHPWLVYEQEGKIAGYAYATQWKQRAAYRYAAESSIYVGEAYIGIGIEETICRFVAQAKGAGHPYSDRRGSLA